MYREFPPVSIDDSDGDECRVSVGMDAQWRHCVTIDARANCHPHTSDGLDPDGARALAAALLEAADEAELRNLEDDSRGYCSVCGSEAVAIRYPGETTPLRRPQFRPACGHDSHRYSADPAPVQ